MCLRTMVKRGVGAVNDALHRVGERVGSRGEEGDVGRDGVGRRRRREMHCRGWEST